MSAGNGRAAIATVLFDLDGTLADTAPDLGYALERLLAEYGHPPVPFAAVRQTASHGSVALIRLGFGIGPDDAGFGELRERFLALYADHIARDTRLFDGMDALLERLERDGLKWGVVTNKPGFLTEPLLRQLGLAQRAATIVSGDTLPQRKPDPAPMLLACRETGCEPAACLYVGDAERDVRAGRNAGMATLVANYGYIGADDDPRQWGADGYIEHPADILQWLQRGRPSVA